MRRPRWSPDGGPSSSTGGQTELTFRKVPAPPDGVRAFSTVAGIARSSVNTEV